MSGKEMSEAEIQRIEREVGRRHMSGHADGYSQADREKDTMTPAKQALRMSGHAETEVEFALLRLCALHTRAVQAFNDHGIEEPQPWEWTEAWADADTALAKGDT